MLRPLFCLAALASTTSAAQVTTYTDRASFAVAESVAHVENFGDYLFQGVQGTSIFLSPSTFGGFEFTSSGRVPAGPVTPLNADGGPHWLVSIEGVNGDGNPVLNDGIHYGVENDFTQRLDIQFGPQQYVDSLSFYIRAFVNPSAVNDYIVTLWDRQGATTVETFDDATAAEPFEFYALFRGYSDPDGIARLRIEVPLGDDGERHRYVLANMTRSEIHIDQGNGFPPQSTFTVVPEPHSLALALMALILLGGRSCSARFWFCRFWRARHRPLA